VARWRAGWAESSRRIAWPDARMTEHGVTGYERRIGRYGASLADRFLAAVEARPGQTALDVGCGTGALTVRLVALLGAANVSAIDPAADDVAACRRRAPGCDVRVAEAEALPYADGRFDLVLAQLVVAHMRDAHAGAGEMRRVARPGGAVAACVWDFAEGMTVLRAFWDAAADIEPAAARLFDQALTHRHSTPAGLAGLWRSAGLEAVRTGELTATTEYAGFDDLWEPMLVVDGTPGRFLATLPDDRIDAVRSRLFARLGEPRGTFALSARAWYVAGTATA
jgi:ubiquinone/menaquinone biosynthesis C-methylase UbiE